METMMWPAQSKEANAYKAEVVERAKGQANRFDNLYSAYKLAPEVTRRRMYIESMEQVLGNTSKVLMDTQGGNNMVYLPIDKILEQNKRGSGKATSGDSSAQQSASSSRQKPADTARGLERLRQSRENRWEGR